MDNQQHASEEGVQYSVISTKFRFPTLGSAPQPAWKYQFYLGRTSSDNPYHVLLKKTTLGLLKHNSHNQGATTWLSRSNDNCRYSGVECKVVNKLEKGSISMAELAYHNKTCLRTGEAIHNKQNISHKWLSVPNPCYRSES